MFEKEYLQGLRSRFVFRCEFCKEEESVFTEAPSSRKKDKNTPQAYDRETKNLNREMVLGAINAGFTHAQIEELFCALGLHIPTSAVFSKYERKMCEKNRKTPCRIFITKWKSRKRGGFESWRRVLPRGSCVDKCNCLWKLVHERLRDLLQSFIWMWCGDWILL